MKNKKKRTKREKRERKKREKGKEVSRKAKLRIEREGEVMREVM